MTILIEQEDVLSCIATIPTHYQAYYKGSNNMSYNVKEVLLEVA